ncbi:MAG TPA: hypothetical protein EYH02_02095 [Ignisphaera aggregans]|uniref:Uncharacterized protein n=1 Tax=Ignisphaera aggregans TaxID=334771 RepID=A0A832YXF7_9CREN|nr:hypothetical protein [Ignisphaera aggregans]
MYSLHPLLFGSIAIAMGVILTALLAMKRLPLNLCIVDDSKVVLVVGTYLRERCFAEVQRLKQFIEEKKLRIAPEDVQYAILYRLAVKKVFLTIVMMTVISIVLQVVTMFVVTS